MEGDTAPWASILREVARDVPTPVRRVEFAKMFAEANPGTYADAVQRLLADTLDTGAAGDVVLWSSVTAPLREESRSSVWSTVHNALMEGAREALSATVVLNAASGDPTIDQLAATAAEALVKRWVTAEPNSDVVRSIVEALRSGKLSRAAVSQVLSRKKPSVPERKAAFEAAREALR
ncbi:hypothetical protein [Microbacterium sufflavum]